MKKLIAWFFGWLTPFIDWLHPAFEETTGRASSSKIGSFAILFLIIWATKKVIRGGNGTITMMDIYLVSILCLFYLLLIGVIKIKEIVEIFKEVKGKDSNDDNDTSSVGSNSSTKQVL